MKPRFKIGQQFRRVDSNVHSALETITDILTTTDSTRAVIKIRYVTEHEFCGQKLSDWDVTEESIAKGRAVMGFRDIPVEKEHTPFDLANEIDQIFDRALNNVSAKKPLSRQYNAGMNKIDDN